MQEEPPPPKCSRAIPLYILLAGLWLVLFVAVLSTTNNATLGLVLAVGMLTITGAVLWACSNKQAALSLLSRLRCCRRGGEVDGGV